jgi:Electron transfer DM13
MARIRTAIREHPRTTALVVVAVIALVAFVLYWFEPQALLIDKRIDEDLPSVSAIAGDEDNSGADGDSGNSDGQRRTDEQQTTSPEPRVVATGQLRGINHSATGDALLIRLSDGSRILRFENLMAENGPDLRVYLSAAPATSEGAAFNDDYIELGELKGNIGNQNYAIPERVDLSRYGTPVIWCKRFEVGFAVADLG